MGVRRVRETYTHEVSPGCPPRFRKRWIIHFSVFIAESKTSIFFKYPRSAQRFKEPNKNISRNSQPTSSLLILSFWPFYCTSCPPEGPDIHLILSSALLYKHEMGIKMSSPSTASSKAERMTSENPVRSLCFPRLCVKC